MSFDWTNTPSSLDDPVSRIEHVQILDHLRLLVDPLDRVGLQHQLAFDRETACEDRDACDRERNGDGPRGERPSQTTRRPSGPSRKSWPFVGDLYSRMPRTASVPMMLFKQIAATPTMSRRPNWRNIGTLAKCNAAKAKIASNVTTRRAGPRLRDVSWIGCSAAVDDHLFLHTRVHLDRVVDADTQHHGQAGDRHDRERDTDVARDTEGPDDAGEHDDEREQPPPDTEQQQQDERHDRDRDRAERQHAAREVVVDVLEKHRRAGRDDRRVLELERVRRCG